MEHTRGYCTCGYYHKEDKPTPTDMWARPKIASSVQELLNYDPVTGKPALNTAGLLPMDIQRLLFQEGLEVWDNLAEPERVIFAEFIRERWVQAKISKGNVLAQKFYGNMLININLGLPIMHGEYAQ